jgi:hypothetical protein
MGYCLPTKAKPEPNPIKKFMKQIKPLQLFYYEQQFQYDVSKDFVKSFAEIGHQLGG